MRTLILLVVLGPLASAADRSASLTREIDQLIQQKLQSEKQRSGPVSSDAEFLRRAYLAFAGRIPHTADVRTFLADSSPHKRRKLIDRLLASPGFANHFTTSWRHWLLPEAVTSPEIAAATPGFEAWLRNRIQTNQPFDKVVTELLTYPLDGRTPAMRPTDDTTNPLAFYQAKEGKPENLAASTSRLFLGVQLECAQCHDHPFAKWSRQQFWGLAAFYGGVTNDGGLREIVNRREITIPNTERTVPATFLDEKQPAWQFRKSSRVTLADWVIAKDNPFFAKAIVNRLWAFLFGVGIVDPVDDFHDQNLPSHPELLDRLATAFVESGYDVQFLLRAIALSEAFQRSSVTTDKDPPSVRLFARFPHVGLTPEQIYDSLSIVTGTPLEGPGGAYLSNGSPKRQFLETFNRTGKPTETQTTILQALTLMNGSLTGTATTASSSPTLSAIVEFPGLNSDQRIEAIYLMTLSRLPTALERKRTAEHIGDHAERYADVLWALLNSVEFRTQH